MLLPDSIVVEADAREVQAIRRGTSVSGDGLDIYEVGSALVGDTRLCNQGKGPAAGYMVVITEHLVIRLHAVAHILESGRHTDGMRRRTLVARYHCQCVHVSQSTEYTSVAL